MAGPYYVDYEGGNDGNSGLSFALRKKLLSSFSPAAGETVRIMASPAPTSLAQNTTWTHTSATVTLTTAVTTTISDCETNWTASANVTCASSTTDFKENTKSQSIDIAAGFTTGLAAYFNTGTLNLSTRQQVSFKIKQTAGTIGAAGAVRLRLCTGTNGTTPVHNIDVPNLVALNQWVSVTVDLATNLNAAIASVSFEVVTDNGAQTFLLDDILACKASSSADSLTLTSLLGYSDSTGAGGSDLDTWYAIASINGTTAKLDNGVNTLATALRGWSGRVRAIESSTNAVPSVITATAHGLITGDVIELRGHLVNTAINGATLTVTKIDANTFSVAVNGNGVGGATGGFWPTTQIRTGYKRETIKTAIASGNVQTIPASGSAGSVITYSGGWNRTDMSTQTDETWFDGQNGTGAGIQFSNTSYVTMSKIAVTRYDVGFTLGATAANIVLSSPGANNSNNGLSGGSSSLHNLTWVALNNHASNAIAAFPIASTFSLTLVCNNSAGGLFANAASNVFTIGTIANNGTGALQTGINSKFTVTGVISSSAASGITGVQYSTVTAKIVANNGTFGLVTAAGMIASVNTYGHSTAGVQVTTARSLLVNSVMAESTRVSGFTALNGAELRSKDDQGVAGAFYIYGDGCNAQTETTVVHTAGTSWKVSPTSTNRGASYKFELTLARFTVVSGLTYSIKCWIRRDNVTTLNAGLLIRGGMINGVPNDISVTASGAINTYVQETLASFTPTESGTLELIGQVWDGTGTTNNAYFDDVTVDNGSSVLTVTMDYADFRTGPGPEPLALGMSGSRIFTGF